MEHPAVILPEEQAPEGAEHCELCELAKQRTRVIWGEGNPRASLMMMLDNPGAREDREGNSFVCGTRETLQLGLREAGIAVDDVYAGRYARTISRRLERRVFLIYSCSSHRSVHCYCLDSAMS